MTPTLLFAVVVIRPSSALPFLPVPSLLKLRCPASPSKSASCPPPKLYQEQNGLGRGSITMHQSPLPASKAARQQGNHSHDARAPNLTPSDHTDTKPYANQPTVITTERAAAGPCQRPGHRARRSEQCVIRKVAARAANFTESRVPRQDRNLYPFPTNDRRVLKTRQPSPIVITRHEQGRRGCRLTSRLTLPSFFSV